MKPFAVENRQDRAAKRSELSQTNMVGDPSQVPCAAVSPEFVSELQSAASMIMSREECELLMQEVESLLRSHPVAA